MNTYTIFYNYNNCAVKHIQLAENEIQARDLFHKQYPNQIYSVSPGCLAEDLPVLEVR